MGVDRWAALVGALLGLLHGVLTVWLSLSQHVAGLGITLLATSLASFAYRVSFPKVDSPPTIQPFAEMAWLPIPVLNAQTPLTLLALGLVPALAWVLIRTPLGLAVRMVGENPAAAEGQGINVAAVRMGAIAAGSALMGVAGAFLTLAAFNAFFFNMVNGRGWVCVALVVFASWRPLKALLGALLLSTRPSLVRRSWAVHDRIPRSPIDVVSCTCCATFSAAVNGTHVRRPKLTLTPHRSTVALTGPRPTLELT